MSKSVGASCNLYDTIKLHSSPEKLVLESADGNFIQFDRHSSELSRATKEDLNPKANVTQIYGIIGTIKLLKGQYLIVITGRSSIGKIADSEIWKISNFDILPLFTHSRLSQAQEADEEKYLNLLREVLLIDGFYFSYDYDLTHSLQRIFEFDESQKSLPFWKRADPRFFWNATLQKDLIDLQLDEWILPITMGFFHIESFNTEKLDWALFSRRSCRRAGLRYVVRGADHDGNVANFVETEQIFSYESDIRSFVQTRGSIPVPWAQKANLKYKPKPKLLHKSNEEAEKVCAKHFGEQTQIYGNHIVGINLINQTGSEAVLVKAYESAVKALGNSNLRVVSFDYHKECKTSHDRLHDLMQTLHKDIEKQGYFRVQFGKVVSKQSGVFRTNCMDNLDRTNVVQSILARENMKAQAVDIREPGFEQVFRHVWTKNANMMSNQYTGTGALKTDITSTGKRTQQGMANDAWNSAMRYYLNNFRDGIKQDALDLFLGNYVVEANTPSPFQKDPLSPLYFLLMVIGALIFFLYFFSPESTLLSVLVWIVAVFLAVRILFFFGPDLVNNPSLIKH